MIVFEKVKQKWEIVKATLNEDKDAATLDHPDGDKLQQQSECEERTAKSALSEILDELENLFCSLKTRFDKVMHQDDEKESKLQVEIVDLENKILAEKENRIKVCAVVFRMH